MTFFKFLKVTLPVATVASTTVATTFLISSFNKKKEQNLKNFDLPINDFELPDDKFEETKKFYADSEEKEDGKKALNDALNKKINDLLEEARDFESASDLTEKIKKVEKEIEKIISNKNDDSAPTPIESKRENVEANQNTSLKKETGIQKEEFKETLLNHILQGDETRLEELESELSTDHESTENQEKELQDSSLSERSSVTEQENQLKEMSASKTASVNKDESKELFSKNQMETSESETVLEKTEEPELFTQEQGEALNVKQSEIATEDTDASAESRAKLNEEDIKKWQDMESQLSSVSTRLKDLINI